MSADFGYFEGAFKYDFNVENGIGSKINYIEALKYYKIALFYGDVKSSFFICKICNFK